jgi:hypothetical protein
MDADILGALQGMDHTGVAPMAAEDDVLYIRNHTLIQSAAQPTEGWCPLDADSPVWALWPLCGAALAVLCGPLIWCWAAMSRKCLRRDAPPGHHAERDRVGFCFSAMWRLRPNGWITRVAAGRDWSISACTTAGTQDLVEDDPRILFCSTIKTRTHLARGRRVRLALMTTWSTSRWMRISGRGFRAAMEPCAAARLMHSSLI